MFRFKINSLSIIKLQYIQLTYIDIKASGMLEDIGEIKTNYRCIDSDDLIRRKYFTVDKNKKTKNQGSDKYINEYYYK